MLCQLLRLVTLCLLAYTPATLIAAPSDLSEGTTLGGTSSAGRFSSLSQGLSGPAEPATLSAPRGLGLGQVEFLPVSDAYRLSGIWSAPRTLTLSWQIAPGYYLYQHQTRVRLDGQSLAAIMPEGVTKYDENLERETTVYYDSLNLQVSLPEQARLPVQLAVDSQGCADAGLCYPPQTQYVTIDTDGTVSIVNEAEPTTASAPAPQTTQPLTNAPALPTYLLALISAVLGGVLLNLMPCVFPVLSLKALSLIRHQQSPHRQHLHGWSYTAGAIATFVAIAALLLTLRASGQAIGWGFQLQNPLFVALLVYLFVAMALSFAGVWQLGGQLSGLGQALTEGNSYRSSFFTGALASVVASPCTAPFMGAALGYAVTQPAAVALTVFAALGFGMAAPYLLLTYLPGLGRRLPKPGPWMETLKQVMAFPLLLTAVWLLWVVGRQTGIDSLAQLLAGALSLSAALWLWCHRPTRHWQKVAALLLLALSTWPLHNLTQPASSHAQDPLWEPYSAQRLQQLLDQQTPVFVNLTADWCITCLANEKIALDTKAGVQAFRQAGVVRLKGDWTHADPEITTLLARFNRNGVPLYLLYSGQPGQPPQVLPQLLSEDTVLSALQQLQPAQ